MITIVCPDCNGDGVIGWDGGPSCAYACGACRGAGVIEVKADEALSAMEVLGDAA